MHGWQDEKKFKPDSVKVILSFAEYYTDANNFARQSEMLGVVSQISFLDISNSNRTAGANDSL